MPEYSWELREPPAYASRHYAVSVDGGKPSRNGANGARIVGVTDVLDAGQGALTGWAARQGVAAGEAVALHHFGNGFGLPLGDSLLTFGEMAVLQPEHPDTYRDHKAALGTALHQYLADRLTGADAAHNARYGELTAGHEVVRLPFGLRSAVDSFVSRYRPTAVVDAFGARVERAIGDYERAVAGTYDGQIRMGDPAPRTAGGVRATHRIDAKTSNTLQPKHWCQLAEYERLAVGCGEEPSDWLTLLHFTPMGECTPHSIRVGSPENELALSLFQAHLQIYRGLPALPRFSP